jgi:carotenoid cleavage dioxygenase
MTPTLSFGSISASGAVTRFDRFEAPYASMVHDFIVTENHLLFPVLPISGSLTRAMQGGPAYAWEPEKGAYVGVMKRNGAAKDITWFRGENCYVFHVMNAWEDGSRVIADVMQFEEAPLFPHPDGSPTDPAKSRARLCRWMFDLAGNTDRFTQTYLDDLTGEFPRIDDRRAGLRSSHGWYACTRPDTPVFGALAGIAHVDGKGARRGHYLLPAGDTISEPVFVARRRCVRRRRLAARRGLARARQLQRPRGVQRHRCRGRSLRLGASRPPRAGRLSRQLGGGNLATTVIPGSVQRGRTKA